MQTLYLNASDWQPRVCFLNFCFVYDSIAPHAGTDKTGLNFKPFNGIRARVQNLTYKSSVDRINMRGLQ